MRVVLQGAAAVLAAELTATSAAAELLKPFALPNSASAPVVSSPVSAEENARILFDSAKMSLGWGDLGAAERKLDQLVTQYPLSKAAPAARLELRRLYARRFGKEPKAALGARNRDDVTGSGQQAPVAGWQTTVVPVIVADQEALVEAAGDRVFFADGSTRLGAKARRILQQQARWLRRNPSARVRIAGHAHDSGTLRLNQRLARQRADAVRRRLIAEGVAPRRISVHGFGRTIPIAICDLRTCAAQNRRAVTEVVHNRRADARVPSRAH